MLGAPRRGVHPWLHRSHRDGPRRRVRAAGRARRPAAVRQPGPGRHRRRVDHREGAEAFRTEHRGGRARRVGRDRSPNARHRARARHARRRRTRRGHQRHRARPRVVVQGSPGQRRRGRAGRRAHHPSRVPRDDRRRTPRAPRRLTRPVLARRPRAGRHRTRTRPHALLPRPARGRPGPARGTRAHPPRTTPRPVDRRRRDLTRPRRLSPADGRRVRPGSTPPRAQGRRRSSGRRPRGVRAQPALPAGPGRRGGIRESRRAVPKNRQVSPNRVRRQDQADRPGRDPLRRVLDARRVCRRRGPGGGARGVRVVVRGRRLCLRLGGRSRGWEPETHERSRSRPVLAFG